MKNDLFHQVKKPFFVYMILRISSLNGSNKVIQLFIKLRSIDRANSFKEFGVLK